MTKNEFMDTVKETIRSEFEEQREYLNGINDDFEALTAAIIVAAVAASKATFKALESAGVLKLED